MRITVIEAVVLAFLTRVMHVMVENGPICDSLLSSYFLPQ